MDTRPLTRPAKSAATASSQDEHKVRLGSEVLPGVFRCGRSAPRLIIAGPVFRGCLSRAGDGWAYG
eukprot:2315814-Lingulodinium_polyedra.AAC.1